MTEVRNRQNHTKKSSFLQCSSPNSITFERGFIGFRLQSRPIPIKGYCQSTAIGRVDPGTGKLLFSYDCHGNFRTGESSEYEILVVRKEKPANIEPDEYKVQV